MPRPVEITKLSGLAARFGAFVAERFPFSIAHVMQAFDAAGLGSVKSRDTAKLNTARPAFRRALARQLYTDITAPEGVGETTPGVTTAKRLEQARAEIVEACDGYLRREAIAWSLTKDERREILLRPKAP